MLRDVQEVMRWLCAPFFFLFFLKMIDTFKNCCITPFSKSCLCIPLWCFLVLLSLYFCIRQHDVNILMLWVSEDERDVCVLRFFLFFFCVPCVPLSTKNCLAAVQNSLLVVMLVDSLIFLHKTTWREYFAVWVSWGAVRCLCAPFSFSLLSCYIKSTVTPKL